VLVLGYIVYCIQLGVGLYLDASHDPFHAEGDPRPWCIGVDLGLYGVPHTIVVLI